MNNSKINSLYGISKNEDEFIHYNNHEGDLLPNNYLTVGPIFDDLKKLRENKKLFNELFYNSDSLTYFRIKFV